MEARTTTGVGQILAGQFAVTGYVLERNLAGLTHEDSLRRPPGGGNCLNWVVGHMADARNKIATALTDEPVFSPARLSAYEGKDDSNYSLDRALAFEELRAMCEEAGEAVISALSIMDDEALGRPAPFSVVGREGETIGSLVATFAFHDAYHAGQTGVLRRMCGFDGVLTPPETDD